MQYVPATISPYQFIVGRFLYLIKKNQKDILSQTRWTPRYEASKCLFISWNDNMLYSLTIAIQAINDDDTEESKTRYEAYELF